MRLLVGNFWALLVGNFSAQIDFVTKYLEKTVETLYFWAKSNAHSRRLSKANSRVFQTLPNGVSFVGILSDS